MLSHISTVQLLIYWLFLPSYLRLWCVRKVHVIFVWNHVSSQTWTEIMPPYTWDGHRSFFPSYLSWAFLSQVSDSTTIKSLSGSAHESCFPPVARRPTGTLDAAFVFDLPATSTMECRRTRALSSNENTFKYIPWSPHCFKQRRQYCLNFWRTNKTSSSIRLVFGAEKHEAISFDVRRHRCELSNQSWRPSLSGTSSTLPL